MPIDGLVSGLDTTSIITQLMALERRPIDQLNLRVSNAQAELDAYSTVRSKLTTLTTSASALSNASGWNLRTATSSSPEVATVTAAAGAQAANITFTVDQIAARHGIASAEVPSSSTVVSGGTLNVTVGSESFAIDTGTGTLADTVAAINASASGLTATAVNTGSGYRLQINSIGSGTESVFTVDSGLSVSSAITSQGADAQLTIGSGPGAYSVTSSTNVFSETFDGVTVTAKSVSATPVNVTVEADATAIAAKVEQFVANLNSALAEIKGRTSYSTETGTAASLAGDSALRRVAQDLTTALISKVGGAGAETASTVGISLDRYGSVSFDSAKFAAAYQAAPDAVRDLFADSATSSGQVSYSSAAAATVEGDYEVIVTADAKKAQVVGMVGAFPVTQPATIKVRVGNLEITYATSPPDSAEDVRDGLQAEIDAAGFGITVASEGGGLSLTSNAYGSNATFDVAFDGINYDTYNGSDVEGTIGGVVATGKGNFLTVPADSGAPSGLSVGVEEGAVGALGTIFFSKGLAGEMGSIISNATDSISGYLTGAENQRLSSIDIFEDSIRRYEDRLVLREERLRSQYAALESALSSLQDQGSFITQQLESLKANS